MQLHLARRNQVAHARNRGRRGSKFRASMHQRQGARLFAERNRPVQRGVPAPANHQVPVEKIGRRLHPVVHRLAFELLDAGDTQAPRLEGADSAGDDHRPGGETGTGRGSDMKFAVPQHAQFGHLLAQMKGGFEGLGLFQQSIDQFLRPADRQRGNVINRLIGIKLGALAAGLAQGIDDVSADPKQSEFEYLEKTNRAGANDDRFYVLFRHVSPRSVNP